MSAGDHFFIDVWREATAAFWEQRAAELEAAAAPRIGDFLGQSTPQQRTQRRRRLVDMAQACRARATLAYVSDAEFRAALIDVGGLPDGLEEAETNCRRAIDRGDLTAIRYWQEVIDRFERVAA